MSSTQWSRTTKRAVLIGLAVLLLLLLYVFRALLPPIAVAVVLAYVLKPVIDFIDQETKLSRTAAILFVYLLLLLLIAVIPATVVPALVERITELDVRVQGLADELLALLAQPITVLGFTVNTQDLVGDFEVALQNLLRPFATQTVNLLLNIASSLLWILSILVISFYLLRDADRLRAFLDRSAPPGYADELRHLREEISQVWKAFFRGQLVLGLSVGTMVWILMSIVGLPYAGVMALLAGLLEVIPTFGPILATIPALIVALARGSMFLPLTNFWFAVLVLALYILVQQTENAYLVPRIMGRRLQLHPVVVFIGVLAGGTLAGVIGVLLAAPVIATIKVFLRYVYAKLLDQDPYPLEEVVTRELYPGEIDAIFFDLDGTLIETDDTVMGTLAQLLRPIKWLLPKRDPAWAARRLLMALERPANGFVTLLDRIGLDDNLFGLGDRLRHFRGLYAAASFCPVDGVCSMLNELSGRYQLGIITTRSRRDAQAFLEQQAMAHLIRVIVGREDTRRLKPHPGPVLYAAKTLGIAPDRCLMVGDTTVDIDAARSAGAWAVGVLCGFGERGELERAGADLILQTTADLVQWM